METQGRVEPRSGVHINRLGESMILTIGVPILNALIAPIFQSNDNIVPNQGTGNFPVNQNLDKTINLNACVD